MEGNDYFQIIMLHNMQFLQSGLGGVTPDWRRVHDDESESELCSVDDVFVFVTDLASIGLGYSAHVARDAGIFVLLMCESKLSSWSSVTPMSSVPCKIEFCMIDIQ